MKPKLRKESAGFYYIDTGREVVHIWKISRGLWGYNIGKGMTRGTARTLRELKEKFIY
jgi:hypothetical protein